MTRAAAILLALLCIAPNTAISQAKRHWIPIPGHKGVFVDLASIQHFPSRHTGGQSNAVPTPDTVADVRIGSHVEETSFWCKLHIVFGDMHEQYTDLNGKVKSKTISKSAIPMDAIYPVVCPKQP